jgi:hypothetical protein
MWFTRGGRKPFTAAIIDKRFLDSYGEGEPRLNAEDLLEVELLEKETVSNGKLKCDLHDPEANELQAGAKKQRLPFQKARRSRKRSPGIALFFAGFGLGWVPSVRSNERGRPIEGRGRTGRRPLRAPSDRT